MADQPLYLDACATTPLLPVAQEAILEVQSQAWGNPSSLHGFGLAAAEALERSRLQLAEALGTVSEAVRFCSGASESVHLALLGLAATLPPGRLVISAVEHPAVAAAAASLQQRGWQLAIVPVDHNGLIDLERLAELLAPPTRVVSVIGGQSEVGTIQPLEAIGRLCRQAGVLFHSDAVQWVPHQHVNFDALPLDLLTLTAHKLGGPRGIAALLVRPGLELQPQIGGGSQERGLRAGTEPVALVAGFAAALVASRQAMARGEVELLRRRRDQLLSALLSLGPHQLSGPDPTRQARLPHHISLVVRDRHGNPLPGRQLVRALWQQGVAASSGSACRSSAREPGPSPVLLAMGYRTDAAAAGLRLSLGPWLTDEQLQRVPQALRVAIAQCSEHSWESAD